MGGDVHSLNTFCQMACHNPSVFTKLTVKHHNTFPTKHRLVGWGQGFDESIKAGVIIRGASDLGLGGFILCKVPLRWHHCWCQATKFGQCLTLHVMPFSWKWSISCHTCCGLIWRAFLLITFYDKHNILWYSKIDFQGTDGGGWARK